MRYSWAVLLTTVLICVMPLQAGDLTREQRHKLQDKATISKSHQKEMVGLREMGNPHLPESSRLRQLKFVEPRDESYREALYQRQQALYGKREIIWDGINTAPSPELASKAESTPPKIEKMDDTTLAILAMVVLAVATVVFRWVLRER